MGSPCGSIRHAIGKTTSAVGELAPSTRRLESGRIQPQLEGARRILFPAIQPYSVLPVRTVGGRSRSDHRHSLLALVPLFCVGDNDNEAYTRADEEIADPQRENENEKIDDEPLIEAGQNIICDP